MFLKSQPAIAMGAPAQVVIRFTWIWSLSLALAKLRVLPDDLPRGQGSITTQGLLFDMEKWYWDG